MQAPCFSKTTVPPTYIILRATIQVFTPINTYILLFITYSSEKTEIKYLTGPVATDTTAVIYTTLKS
jgi:hypothetical protein